MKRGIIFILALIIISGFSTVTFASVLEIPQEETFKISANVVKLNDENDNQNKNPLIAMVLSFFIPGLGQVFNGEYIKGIGLFTSLAALGSLDILVIEPAVSTSITSKTQNSLLGIAAMIARVGIPVLWVYGWGSAYQSADPEYQKKLREEKKKKEEEKEKAENISNNLIQIQLLSVKF